MHRCLEHACPLVVRLGLECGLAVDWTYVPLKELISPLEAEDEPGVVTGLGKDEVILTVEVSLHESLLVELVDRE